MPRAVRESATAKGMTPPAAIRPTGDEICRAPLVMAWAAPSSTALAAVSRQAQSAMLAIADEGQNFRNRRIFDRQGLHRVQPFGKHSGSIKQLLIKRSHHREAPAGEVATFHADDVEAFEAGVLAVDEAERNHVAANTADTADHYLRPDPGELMHRGQAADENKIADFAVASQSGRRREDHVIADLAIMTDVAAIHEITAIPDASNAAAAHGAGVHGHLLPDGAALADLKPGEFAAISQRLRRRAQ